MTIIYLKIAANADGTTAYVRSLLGRTSSKVRFGSKADMCSARADVGFVPIADIAPI